MVFVFSISQPTKDRRPGFILHEDVATVYRHAPKLSTAFHSQI